MVNIVGCYVFRGLKAPDTKHCVPPQYGSLIGWIVCCVALCGTDGLINYCSIRPNLAAQLAQEVIWGHSATHHCGRQMVAWCVFVSFDTTCVLCIITLSLPPSFFFFFIYPSFPVGLLLSSIHSRSIAHVCPTFFTFFPLLCLPRLWWIAFTGQIALHSSLLLTDLTNMIFSSTINKLGFVLWRTNM